MCNIAGYIGKKAAAPILIEMLKRQEGLAGGYYTGLATIEGGKMHYAKCVGETEDLLKSTDALDLPGNTGLIHSRSKSGGGREWGHPFVNTREDLAYVANGAAGYFRSEALNRKQQEIIRALEGKGHVFRSRTPGAIGNYPRLEDGASVHSSDLMCQLISHLIDEGLAPDAAMSRAFSERPSEVVGLIVRAQNPGRIYVTRINFPMMIGIAEDGDVYLSSAALAFPQDVRFRVIEPLPALATCEVFQGGWRVSPCPVEAPRVAPITPGLWAKAYARLESYLTQNADKPPRFSETVAACRDLWGQQPLTQEYQLVYEILRDFRNQGRLELVPVAEDGAFEGYTAHRLRLVMQ